MLVMDAWDPHREPIDFSCVSDVVRKEGIAYPIVLSNRLFPKLAALQKAGKLES